MTPEPAIDVHAHHVPSGFLRRLKDAAVRKRFPHCTIEDVAGGAVRLKVGTEPWTRPVAPGLLHLAERTQRLTGSAIVAQLNGGWLDLFGYSLPAEEGAAWSALFNDTLRESLDAASTSDVRYVPLATVPLQDGAAAAAELARAAAAGHAGAMIGTWIPSAGGGDDTRIHDLGLVNAVARPNETALAVSRLLYGGVLERHPALKLVVAHGGGALPAMLGRLARNYELPRAAGERAADPSAGFAKPYFDSVVFAPRALRALLGGNACAAFPGLRSCCGAHFPE